MRKFIYPYKDQSISANLLKENLGIRRIKTENSRYRYRDGDIIINWGCSNLPPQVMNAQILNHPDIVSVCTNKLSFFNFISDAGVDNLNIPEYTTDQAVAKDWYESGKVIFGRKRLNAHSGIGIEEYNKNEGVGEFDVCPLYVKYIPKREEYRVHIANGEIFLVQRKALIEGTENPNFKIRNRGNGFIFARNEGRPVSEKVLEQANILNQVLGLDFMAVDIIYNEYRDTAYILEVNTAPGLQGTTLEDYTAQFQKYFEGVE